MVAQPPLLNHRNLFNNSDYYCEFEIESYRLMVLHHQRTTSKVAQIKGVSRFIDLRQYYSFFVVNHIPFKQRRLTFHDVSAIKFRVPVIIYPLCSLKSDFHDNVARNIKKIIAYPLDLSSFSFLKFHRPYIDLT